MWDAYRSKRGSLNFGIRIERSFAIIAQMMANRYRKEGATPFTFYDFAPHIDEPEMTIDDLRKWE